MLEQKGKLHMLLMCQLPHKNKSHVFHMYSESKPGREGLCLSLQFHRNGSMTRGAPPRATKWHAQIDANATTACGLQVEDGTEIQGR